MHHFEASHFELIEDTLQRLCRRRLDIVEKEDAFAPFGKLCQNPAFYCARISRVEVAGIDVDVEDALGLDSTSSVFFGRGFYRFGSTRRHRFDFSYSAYRRDATKVLFQDVPIFDVIFPEGSSVQTEFNFDIIRAGYSYSFFKDDRMDLGVGAG